MATETPKDSERGYVRLHRKSISSAVFGDATLWRVWTWCIMRANHEPGRFLGVPIPRGSFATGIRSAAKELKMPPTTVHRSLKRLAKMKNIGTRTEQVEEQQFTVVTVCNYERYNKRRKPDGTGGGRKAERRRNRGGTGAERIEESKESKEPPPQTPPGNEPAPGAPHADPWRGVGEELAKVGVGKWRSLVADCQQARLTPEIVLALIEHYRRHAPSWGPGALVNRIGIQTPEGPAPDQGWPDPAAEAIAKRNREDAEQRRQSWDARMQRERSAAEQDRQRLADLEAEHGPTVDAMPRDELRELLSDLPALAAKVANEGPLSPLVRSMAIELVASRQPQPP